MTEFRVVGTVPSDVDIVAHPVPRGTPTDLLPAGFLAGVDFDGSLGQVVVAPETVLFGLGDDGEADLRHAAGELARAVAGFDRVAVVLPPGGVRAAVEGMVLGGYQFTRYKTAGGTAPSRVDLVCPDAGGLAEGLAVARAVCLARDLVNEPGETLTPVEFAHRAQALARANGFDCEVWDEHRIADERLGGLLGVSRGSPRPPRLVRLRYRPPPGDAPVIALVGKGVTYDSGGLSLKPTPQMVDMKADMAGAAAVLAAVSALAELSCPVGVDAWLPLTENMPNADPVRVGDVLRLRGGTTVEVRNADAEGRLILADALTLACESGPAAVLDLATLTDAAAIALGREFAAVMGDQPLVDRVLRAAALAGEPLWQLPLPARYRRQLASGVADLVNYTTGVRHGTALLAGLFLREFVAADVPWAHLDLQGPALAERTCGESVTGATGYGTRLLIELLAGTGPNCCQSWPQYCE
ncbi:leucyl aminopeptidase [Actinokineospora sp. NBRC 105648]|uniref:leucyl aminopeptidase n=1 Tax=Actinokineospora sp. NBRC 105648 TaxID=3032206 RepID=UPI0024A56B8B|nr:leucyl aminopeptidase [Actinokineospora sp. NBRC 105648]GLZ38923.1 putative cytosol aminopeptidase [Actinokineospora sp. NBRC 105648]